MRIAGKYGRNGGSSGLLSLAGLPFSITDPPVHPFENRLLQRSADQHARHLVYSGQGDQLRRPSERAQFTSPVLGSENSPNSRDIRIENAQVNVVGQPSISVRLTAPVSFFKKLIELWNLDEETSAKFLGFDHSRYVRHLFSGARSLRSRDEKDRVRYLFRIHEVLFSLFQDTNVECDWLREPRSELEEYSPMDLLSEGSMSNMLLVKQFVERMAGR